jgi:hypothetical protein
LLLRLVEASNTNATSIGTLAANVQVVSDSVKQLSDKIDQFVEIMLRNTGNGRGRSPAA